MSVHPKDDVPSLTYVTNKKDEKLHTAQRFAASISRGHHHGVHGAVIASTTITASTHLMWHSLALSKTTLTLTHIAGSAAASI